MKGRSLRDSLWVTVQGKGHTRPEGEHNIRGRMDEKLVECPKSRHSRKTLDELKIILFEI